MSEHEALMPRQIGEIAGRNSVSQATPADVSALLAHIAILESFLDDWNQEDAFGTEGWRHHLGLED